MYSGTTLTKFSGRILGGHQKLDRIARRHLRKLEPRDSLFPGIRLILHFEGKNGPDGIKRKSPARDEPWHYYDPYDDEDNQLIDLIEAHYSQLVHEIRGKNKERAAFEAAWLAHALTDGLTPAHHYPYEEELVRLRGGKGIESRTTLKEKLLMHGETPLKKVKNNWKMWGGKGLMTTHGTFELGMATLIAPLAFGDSVPKKKDVNDIKRLGVAGFFRAQARLIANLNMYERYYEKGWTPRLAYDVRHKLGPCMVKTITLAWHSALEEAKDTA